ncbi:tyrosine-type recombinase/integrase [Nonomuraea muscovyensis]|uniref:Integrase n=1 Tax=Nonomuraea muscovyensis TaxID=1124761 RepID=A0A7X0C7C5_9ACTN|nr:tyrosine-type recombinase/integrase [Nonomuraea muscovyensis]MBB6349857.1 integrase [Nonomuraea muscovyensis]
MPNNYPPEFRRQMVELVRAGRTPEEPAKEFRPSAQSIRMVWTPEQTRLFLEEARRHRLFALYRLITLRGLRRGEACGLRWKDVDLDEGSARIAWQLVQLAGQIHEGRPKTDASMRTIALPTPTRRFSRRWRWRRRRRPRRCC